MKTLSPFQPHSRTSRKAAKLIEPSEGSLCKLVLTYLRTLSVVNEGATDGEMQNDLQLSGDTQRPRRIELVDAGLVIDSGTTRKTKSGHDAVVWVAK